MRIAFCRGVTMGALSVFFDYSYFYLDTQREPAAQERARHVASRRVKTLKKKLAFENHLRLFSFKFFYPL